MSHPFDVLPSIPLKPGSSFGPETKPLAHAHRDSPAVTVMTDFRTVTPVTIDTEIPIDRALKKMKTAGVRLLFVTNDAYEIIGLITANDILGERPITYTQQTRMPRSNITVAAIMTPQRGIQVLDAATVQMATVGDIIATLHALERQHALVAKIDEETQAQTVIGMFSTSQISKLLGQDVMQGTPPAHSLAEIVEKIS
ncbi:MAG: CBS domain-containing protein [Gammaproteobacteria bacterium]|nr:CBS domain-containing protein [Gammaproteobacteria bacterium]MDH3370950.1 CBS domain-containing protein [Gammaproteobacteria bacterium]MDH3406960.1 CBS domain-containing protein [Gammaproteobacteria bacterium]MDH5487362.1 CBS domain-containing protein [Gammaproteobacteria bacterium]